MNITDEHIILLKIISESEEPYWHIISKSKPPGQLWTDEVVAKLVNDLDRSGMITQANATAKIKLTEEGIRQLHHRKTLLEKEEDLAKMSNEKLHLEIVKLRNDFFDYNQTKANSKNAILLAKIATAAAILSAAIALFKK